MKLATLRACASCEWIFRLPASDGCPKCQFGHYGAHYVYGKRAYRYAITQRPWYEKKLAAYSFELSREIEAARPLLAAGAGLGVAGRGRGRGR